MLVEFSVENYRSLRDRQTLTMVATADATHESTHVVNDVAPGVDRVLRSAVIYGANGAGKSNLINALDCFRAIVVSSATKHALGDKLPIQPFLLDESSSRPTCFEIVFVAENVKYHFGLVATSERVFEEWLIAFPEKRAQEWYRRKYLISEKRYSFKYSTLFKGQKQLWANATRPDSLFLSTAVHLNSEQLLPVFTWFKSQLRLITSGELHGDITKMQVKQGLTKQIVSLLKSFDAVVEDLTLVEGKPDKELVELFDKISDEGIRSRLVFDHSSTVKVLHRGADGREVWLDLEDESRGTVKLFEYAAPLIESIANGYTLVIDELNNSLHPLLVKKIVDIFNDPSHESNPQLIFATHGASILNLDVFRRDQIWFAEKGLSGDTSIYSLAEFSPRKGSAVGKGYLQGRYGAVPLLAPGIE